VADPRGFETRLKAYAAKVEQYTDDLVRRVALAVDTVVVLSTPVKSGRARANWQANVGEAAGGTVPAPSVAPAAVPQAMQQAGRAIAMYNGSGTIHITNNLPYIKRLNEGYSTQSPAGFVEMAVAAGRDAVGGTGVNTSIITEVIK
jgi:hypothetical protein